MTDRDWLYKDYFISVIAVIEDDADLLEAFVKDVAAVLKAHYENYEIVLIDNDSVDRTPLVIQALLAAEDGIRYIKLSRRYPFESAMSAGLDTAIGDVIITIEPQCDPPHLIPLFVEKTVATSGVVYGIRTNYDLHMPASYRIGKAVFHQLCNLVFEFSPPRSAGFFMGLNRPALNAIVQMRGKAKFLRVFGKRIGHKIDTIPYEIEPRRRLKRRSVVGSIDYGVAVIFTNSSRPLRLISMLAIAAAGLNVAYLIVAAVAAILGRRPLDAVALLGAQLALTFLFVFLIVTIICEHYIRSAENATDAPTYSIDHERTSSVMVLNQEQRRNVCDAESFERERIAVTRR